MNRLLTLLISLSLFSCDTNRKKNESNLLDFKSFTIESPQFWEKIEYRGVDSYVGGIKFDSTQGVSFDLGLYSNELSEFVRINLNDSIYFFVQTGKSPPLMGDSSFMEKIKKCKVTWDTIDGYKAKLVIPINSGFGVTGIYIDSLWHTESGNVKFQLSGNNLTPKNETDLIKAFKTLRFNRNT